VVANVELRKKTSDASAVQARAKPNVVVPAVASRPDDSMETARVPKADKSTFSDRWRLTARRPPSCSHCRHHVNPEFMEVMVDRKVWVFCGKRCRRQWRVERSPLWKADLPEPTRSRP
jgi:hypothetical protein